MTQFIPSTFYGIQNFLDNLNACNAQLDIQVEKNIITVKATRARKESKCTYERSFRLTDDIDTENIKVSLENGVLSFQLAKKQQAAARKLTVD